MTTDLKANGNSTQQNEAAMIGTAPPKLTPSMIEQTRAQVGVNSDARRSINVQGGSRTPFLEQLIRDNTRNTSAFYAKVRMMRLHPTISLTRRLTIAVMAQAPWSIKCEPDAPKGAKEYAEKYLLPLQNDFMRSALRGTFDFGWQAFEKVFAFDRKNCHIVPGKLKPLLQDQTDIVVRSETGSYAGVMQLRTLLTPENALLINREVEGTYYYGEGKMSAMEGAFNRWLVTDDANVRYDNKISGAHWVIHYPVGNTPFQGSRMDNYTIANMLLNGLQGSGSIVVPDTVNAVVDDLNGTSGAETAWKIELMTADASAQVGFQQRLAYLDTCMVRAGGLPERAILEGQYGTKAEAEAHADFGVSSMDDENGQILNQFNKQFSDQLIGLNFGAEAVGKVRAKVAPIADDKLAMIKQVYMQALANPTVGTNELNSLDFNAMRDQLELPVLSMQEQMQQQGGMMGGGQDYSGMGQHGGSDPMLRQFLAHLNGPEQQEQTGPQMQQQRIPQVPGQSAKLVGAAV